jgi:hypothetical protein
MKRKRPKTYEVEHAGRKVRVTVPETHETVAYSGDAKDVLRDVLQDNLSPQAVAAIAGYLQNVKTNDRHVDEAVAWFAGQLREMLGGDEEASRLAEELGL